MALGEHVKSIIYSTIGTILSTVVIVAVLWLKGLAFYWAMLITAGFTLAVAMAANYVGLIVERYRKPRSQHPATNDGQTAVEKALIKSNALPAKAGLATGRLTLSLVPAIKAASSASSSVNPN